MAKPIPSPLAPGNGTETAPSGTAPSKIVRPPDAGLDFAHAVPRTRLGIAGLGSELRRKTGGHDAHAGQMAGRRLQRRQLRREAGQRAADLLAAARSDIRSDAARDHTIHHQPMTERDIRRATDRLAVPGGARRQHLDSSSLGHRRKSIEVTGDPLQLAP